MLPFSQKAKNGLLVREFSKDVDTSELVWHRDKRDRDVYVKDGAGWKIQMENSLPEKLTPGKTYHIPKNTYHRIFKGNENLIVEITEY